MVYTFQGKSENEENDFIIDDIGFSLKYNDSEIKLWKSTYVEYDSYYLFLPKIREEDCLVSQANDEERYITIDDKNIGIGEEWPYNLHDGVHTFNYKGEPKEFNIYTLSEIPSVFIETKSGSMDYIYEDKKNTVKISFSLYDNTNSGVFLSGSIRGRGNTSWGQKKRPFLVEFDKDIGLLGMKRSSKWVLISNAGDFTNMRNKIVFDAAQELGFAFSPQCQYVNLYLNGIFNGLYLIMEKIEFTRDKLWFDRNDGYLLSLEYRYRKKTAENPFFLESGYMMEIKHPSRVSKRDKKWVQRKMQMVENAIISEKNDLFTLIDIESWAKKYLIDEVFMDGDSGLASEYFYLPAMNDCIVYAGPPWDYDGTMMGNPRSFIANTEYKRSDAYRPWYYHLYNNHDFQETVKQIYKNVFHDIISTITERKIDEYKDEIIMSVVADVKRWNIKNSFALGVQNLKEFLDERMSFLDENWIKGIKYTNICFDVEPLYQNYIYYSIKSGGDMPSKEEVQKYVNFLDLSDLDYWVDEESNQKYNVGDAVTRNMRLKAIFHNPIARDEEEEEKEQRDRIFNANIILIPFSLLCGFIVCFVFLEWRRKCGR